MICMCFLMKCIWRSRFNKDADLSTRYRTKSILCAPIIGRAEQVIGVTQMINKQGEIQEFTQGDVDLTKAFNVSCGIALSNANLFDDTNTMKNRVWSSYKFSFINVQRN